MWAQGVQASIPGGRPRQLSTPVRMAFGCVDKKAVPTDDHLLDLPVGQDGFGTIQWTWGTGLPVTGARDDQQQQQQSGGRCEGWFGLVLVWIGGVGRLHDLGMTGATAPQRAA